MALDINQLRAAFAKKSEGNNSNENEGFWQKFFPFYKMDFDQVSTVRFLPDANEDNPFGFIVENVYHEIVINGKKKKFACLKMHDGKDAHCPFCAASQKYYDAGDKDLGKVFWRKIDYIAQCIIVSCPFDYPVSPTENPVRLVSLSNSLYKKIENAIMKDDLDALPYDMNAGYDFRIEKAKKSTPDRDYGDYSNSAFARRSTSISNELLARIERYDLSKYRFARIEPEQMEIAVEAYLTGKDFSAGAGNDAATNDVNRVSEAVNEGASKFTKSADEVISTMTQAAPAPAASTVTVNGAKLSPQEILEKLKANRKLAGQ